MNPVVKVAREITLTGDVEMVRSDKRKVRSRFWVATTHVLTAGFAMPLVIGFVGTILVAMVLPPSPETFLLSAIMQQCFIATGWIAGTYYSLSYIRKTCIMSNPSSYIAPCIIAGVVMLALCFLLSSAAYVLADWPEALIVTVVSHCIAYLSYATITRNAFKQMRPDRYA